MIPFKYYIQIYNRYLKLAIQNKKQNIKEWFNKSKEDKYKYFNPDKEENIVYDNSDNIISGIFKGIEIGSNSMDKVYCKDMNRQLHYSKGRLKTIYNTLQSIFNQHFSNFYLMKNTNKSIEKLADDINNTVKKITLYFFLAMPILFIIILLFSGISLVTYNLPTEASSTVTNIPSPSSTNFDSILIFSIFAVIGLYLIVTILFTLLFNAAMFVCLWKFVNKNTKIVVTNIG
ncbi:MAG: hypothetical protein IJU54_01575 [Alphaproteobacteria bacterium]|nr:hypothetical protein [Alphaproteobacteria bacterium]